MQAGSPESKVVAAQHHSSMQARTTLQAAHGPFRDATFEGIAIHLPLLSRQYPGLEGRDKEVAALTERAFQALMERHADKAVDGRGQTHLQVARARFLVSMLSRKASWIGGKFWASWQYHLRRWHA